MLRKPDDDVSLLGLMKHPFAAAGGRPAVFRARIREYERKVLRGGEKDETAESFIREKRNFCARCSNSAGSRRPISGNCSAPICKRRKVWLPTTKKAAPKIMERR